METFRVFETRKVFILRSSQQKNRNCAAAGDRYFRKRSLKLRLARIAKTKLSWGYFVLAFFFVRATEANELL